MAYTSEYAQKQLSENGGGRKFKAETQDGTKVKVVTSKQKSKKGIKVKAVYKTPSGEVTKETTRGGKTVKKSTKY